MTNVPFFESFIKSQSSSILATSVDFVIYFILYKGIGIYYGLSSGIGAVGGAILSFILGRVWAFRRKDGNFYLQALRYLITSSLSVVLNTGGMIWMTETFSISPNLSKLVAAIIIGVFFNFFMFRHFVYR